ncbi:CchlQ [Frankia sp. AiPs1]|uniref:CchlQ n=1 Tax=Frankia sp. AiPa1 TaxID=573492 RepID=UPI00202B2C0C|nr:CchlQ [Frankia sp. AiPa1]MCL9762319.1 CchlQ [Frankia sp. AiPa1]
MDWGTLVATLSGAAIAIAGTVLADHLGGRRTAEQVRAQQRREVYIAFITAAGIAHSRLRQLAQIAQDGPGGGDPDVASRAALVEAGIYEVRERLFLDASHTVVGAGQAMFQGLRELRRVVAGGAALSSAAFHDAYHPYLDAVWHYRAAVRAELDTSALSLAVFGWNTWDGTDRCPLCRPDTVGT